MYDASYWLSASVLTITSAPSFRHGVEAGLEAVGEALVVGQPDDVVDAVRTRDLDGAIGRAVVDDEPLDAVEPVHLARQVGQRLGERLLLVEAGDLDDQLHRLRRKTVPRASDWLARMEGTTLTRPEPGNTSARPEPSLWDRGDRLAKIAFALLCVGFVVGFFVFPTYPVYDSYYSLLWGRDLLRRRRARLRGLPLPDRAPAGDRRGRRAAAVRRLGRPALGGAHAGVVPGADRGRLPARPAGRDAARRRGRGGAADDPLRLPVPGRPRLHRHPLHGARRVGGVHRGPGAAQARRDRCCCCSRWPGMLRPEAWFLAAMYWVWVSWSAPWRLRFIYAGARGDRPADVGDGRLPRHREPVVLAAVHVRQRRGSRPPAVAVASCPSAIPTFFQNLVKLPVFVAAGVGARVRSCDLAAADADADRAAGRRPGDVHRHRRRRRVGDRALPRGPRAGADGARGGRDRGLDDARRRAGCGRPGWSARRRS